MTEPYEGWAIAELMGHRRLVGKVSQVEQYGTAMLRVDALELELFDGVCVVHGPVSGHHCEDLPPKENWTTHFYGGSAIYGVTPSDEATVRRLALPFVSRISIAALPEPSDGDEEEWDR